MQRRGACSSGKHAKSARRVWVIQERHSLLPDSVRVYFCFGDLGVGFSHIFGNNWHSIQRL